MVMVSILSGTTTDPSFDSQPIDPNLSILLTLTTGL